MHGWHYLSYFFAQHSIFCWAFRVSFQYFVIWLCRGHIPDSYHESKHIYIYRAYYKLDLQLFNSCQIIYKPLYVLGSKHGVWFPAIPCHRNPDPNPPVIKRGWKITERDGWILPLQPRGWLHLVSPWVSQYHEILFHISTITLLSLLNYPSKSNTASTSAKLFSTIRLTI